MESKYPFAEYDHSVMPSLDYPFATSFYPLNDPRYALKQEFEKLIWHHKKIRIYNCKFQTPKISPQLLNVYVYLYDSKIIIRNDEKVNNDFLELFNMALKTVPTAQASDKISRVFLTDYSRCSKAYSLDQSEKELRNELNQKYSYFKKIEIWNDCPYVFFSNNGYNKTRFDSGRKKELRQFCYNIIKKYDSDNIWSYDEFHLRLDSQRHYEQYPGRHYFNSDAMDENTFI
jgi:hypothetical protein